MTVSSNAAIPGAEALSIKVRLIRDNDFGQIFGVFVAEMAGKPKANGRAVVWRQRLAIHAIGEQRLRMKGVGHINAVPQYAHDSGILILVRERNEPDISRLRAGFDEVQNAGQPDAGPFGNVGPTFLAGVQQYMAFRRQAFQLVERKGYGTLYQSFDLQAPILEAVRQQTAISLVLRSGAVHRSRA